MIIILVDSIVSLTSFLPRNLHIKQTDVIKKSIRTILDVSRDSERIAVELLAMLSDPKAFSK